VLAEITPDPIDASGHERFVARGAAGAVVSFRGVVRDHDRGRSVRGLEYTAHPTASRVLGEILAEALAGGRIRAAAASHRVGLLAVGDTAFAVAVSGTHRQEAFDAAGRIVDEAKRRLPVWKRQLFTDGTQEWVRCP